MNYIDYVKSVHKIRDVNKLHDKSNTYVDDMKGRRYKAYMRAKYEYKLDKMDKKIEELDKKIDNEINTRNKILDDLWDIKYITFCTLGTVVYINSIR